MPTTPLTTNEPIQVIDVDEIDTPCAACPHPAAAHDIIGSRFCSATAAGGLDRGCVCSTTTRPNSRMR
jgi:hypothetical protein